MNLDTFSASMSSNIRKYKKTTCRYCETGLQEPFLDLGAMALANSFLAPSDIKKAEFICPLELVRCQMCTLIQLSHVVPADIMFSKYLYVSSTTKSFQHHFENYARILKEKVVDTNEVLAVDIGSNDGLLLSYFKKEGFKSVGVEPAKNLSDEANGKGLESINDFFGKKVADSIVQRYGKAHVITANNVFAHIDDVHEVCNNVRNLLDDNGIFVIEFPYLIQMMDNMLFDMIYHEHLSYISVSSLTYLLTKFNLEIFEIQEVASHGGSLRVFCKKKDGPYLVSQLTSEFRDKEKSKNYLTEDASKRFASKVMNVKFELLEFVRSIKKEGKTISGYGAPAKASTIINYCGFTPTEIAYIVDDNPLKQDMLAPGSKIPIVSKSYLYDKPTDYVIIFAWNFADEIIGTIGNLKAQGIRFIIPLPKPQIIDL